MDEFIHMGICVFSNKQMMPQRLNIPDCLKSPIYGARLCVESEFRRQYYHEEYPLYYFLGYTRLAVRLVPGRHDARLSTVYLTQ